MEAKDIELVRRIEEKMGRPIFTEQGKKDSQWMSEHTQELVDRYAGKWIAVYKGEVVAVGDNSQEVVELAKEQKGAGCTPVTEFVVGGKYVY
jgi:hypothetical protein